MPDNPLIAFLSSYGSTSASDSLVDETIRLTAKKHGVRPIEAKAAVLDRMVENFASENPSNLILTGTAGDGKTYHLRKFYLDVLGGDEHEWTTKSGGNVLVIDLSGGRKLNIIKDLSELNSVVKETLLPRIASSLLGHDTKNVWLLAANDGQLLQFWREASQASGDGENASSYKRIYKRIMDMLRDENESDETGAIDVKIYNLSRLVEPTLFNEIIDSIVNHEKWDTDCKGCGAFDACPIRCNRSLLIDCDTPFRRRLVDIMQISSMNDKHIPIRYILVLIVNILLGDKKRIDRPLLTCRTARRRASDGEYRLTNPFNNALGLNFRPRDIEKFPVFSILETFAIGLETNNLIDRFLLSEPTDHEAGSTFSKLEAIDPIYGSAIFENDRSTYMRGSDQSSFSDFDNSLAMQRRRLFFLLDAKKDNISPWDLTIFQHAGTYLDFTLALDAGDKDQEDIAVRAIIKGINRTLTGMMTEDSDRLWLARSIGRLEGAVGRITLAEPPHHKGGSAARIFISQHPTMKRPQIRVGYQAGPMKAECESVFDLRPLQFEYLMRVSGGSLPSSFSRQCQQELRHFALVSAKFLKDTFSSDEPSQSVNVLSLNQKTGKIQQSSLDI